MIKLNLKINESERNRILSLHEKATKNNYLMLEQEVTPEPEVSTLLVPEPLEFNFSGDFKSGQYSLTTQGKIELDNKINEIVNYVNKYNDSFKLSVKIVASESKVTQTGGAGDLSEKRATYLENYIKPLLPPDVTITKETLDEQGPEWDRIKNPKVTKDDPRYTAHQWVKLFVRAEFDICKLKVYSKGGEGEYPDFLSFQKDFDVRTVGNKKVLFNFKCYNYPDLVKINLDGRKIHEVWFGADTPIMRLFIGTFLNSYAEQLQIEKGRYSIKEMGRDDVASLLAKFENPNDVFGNMFPDANLNGTNIFASNPNIKPFTLIPGIIQEKGGLPVDFTQSSKDLNIDIVSPLGMTKWEFETTCMGETPR